MKYHDKIEIEVKSLLVPGGVQVTALRWTVESEQTRIGGGRTIYTPKQADVLQVTNIRGGGSERRRRILLRAMAVVADAIADKLDEDDEASKGARPA